MITAVAIDYLLIAAARSFLSLPFDIFSQIIKFLPRKMLVFVGKGCIRGLDTYICPISQHQYSALEKEYCKSVNHFCLHSNDDEVVHVTTPYLRPQPHQSCENRSNLAYS